MLVNDMTLSIIKKLTIHILVEKKKKKRTKKQAHLPLAQLSIYHRAN